MEKDPKKGVAYALTLAKASTLAKICGCSPQAVADWKKRGEIPPRRAKQIAAAFNVPASRLNPLFDGR